MTRLIWGSGGGAGSDDIAYVEANDLGTANASGASDLIEILKAYDNWGNISPVTAASESVTPAADASNLWTICCRLSTPAPPPPTAPIS